MKFKKTLKYKSKRKSKRKSIKTIKKNAKKILNYSRKYKHNINPHSSSMSSMSNNSMPPPINYQPNEVNNDIMWNDENNEFNNDINHHGTFMQHTPTSILSRTSSLNKISPIIPNIKLSSKTSK